MKVESCPQRLDSGTRGVSFRTPIGGSVFTCRRHPVHFTELLVQNDEVAVLLSGLMAFPAGFAFSVILLSRLNPSPIPFHSIGQHPTVALPAGAFRFGIGLADGTKVIADRRWLAGQPDGYKLRPQGGGGGGRSWRQSFLFEPLPPPGLLEFVCEWPAYGLPESRLGLDAAVIVEAAGRAKALWPDDVGLPEPTDPQPAPGVTRRLAAGLTTQVLRASQPAPQAPSESPPD